MKRVYVPTLAMWRRLVGLWVGGVDGGRVGRCGREAAVVVFVDEYVELTLELGDGGRGG